MTVTRERTKSESGTSGMAGGWRALGWLFAVAGAISLFLGIFVMFGNETSSVGIGGDLSWQVSEVSDAWMYGLLIGGGLALLGALSIFIFGPRRVVADTSGLPALAGHAAVFVLVNTFIWIQDISIGGGVDYAYLVTIPWAIGLAIHGLALASRRQTARPGTLEGSGREE